MREEWDFRARFKLPAGEDYLPFEYLDDAEVVPCHAYEVSREEERRVAAALAWRERCDDKTFGGFLAFWPHSKRTPRDQRPTTEFYVLWPEWPTVPYLRIPGHVRRKRLELWTGRKFKRVSTPKRIAWETPELIVVGMHFLFAHAEIIREKPTWYHGPLEDAVVKETITFTGSKWRPWKTREFVTFDVNWLESNETLVEKFRQWIERRRDQNGIKARETRGPTSFVKELRANLTALGAWRLVQKFGLSLPNAHRYTEKQSGKPLFANPETWRRNLKWITSPVGILWGVVRE